MRQEIQKRLAKLNREIGELESVGHGGSELDRLKGQVESLESLLAYESKNAEEAAEKKQDSFDKGYREG